MGFWNSYPHGAILALTSGLRESLWVEQYPSRRLSGSGGIARILGPSLRWLASWGLRAGVLGGRVRNDGFLSVLA